MAMLTLIFSTFQECLVLTTLLAVAFAGYAPAHGAVAALPVAHAAPVAVAAAPVAVAHAAPVAVAHAAPAVDYFVSFPTYNIIYDIK